MVTGPLYLTRKVEFAAAHRLYREDWSEEKNREVFGLCANPHGHGHNYVLEVTVQGKPDPQTGMVVHFTGLRRLLDELVVLPLDHTHLNYDSSLLKGLLPTSENLVVKIWEALERATRGQDWGLFRLRLASSEKNWVDYFGPEGQQ